MASLAQLLASHGSILVLDAASTRVQVGLLRPGSPARWREGPGDAGQLLFSNTETCLREAGLNLADVGAFAYCEGPGSMLGCRTVAMALRTWQAIRPRPIFRYQSLALLAHGLRQQRQPVPFSVIADARRDTWHQVTVTETGDVMPMARTSNNAIAGGGEPLWIPSAFRSWASPPRAGQDCAYDIATLFTALPATDIFTQTDNPEAFQHEAPEYKKWSAVVHQAPSGQGPV